MRIGYACINKTLAEKKIQVNRGMIKNTFLTKGIPYASQLSLKNIQDLEKVIDWNIDNGIFLYRMSSDMFPWMSDYELLQLSDYHEIRNVLQTIGQKAIRNGLRLTFHPGPFNVLASPNHMVVKKTIKELRQHAEIMNMLGLPSSPYSKINIHVGGAYGDKEQAIYRFVKNFKLLPSDVKSRLTIENDDKANLFSVKDLLLIHDQIGIPIVFDFLHHKFCSGGWTEKKAFLSAINTWPVHVTPIVHYSSSKHLYEDPNAPEAAHADYIHEPIPLYGKEVDLMLEAKEKELAILKFIKDYRIKEYEKK
jgi:UV DNA damage endonuclease